MSKMSKVMKLKKACENVFVCTSRRCRHFVETLRFVLCHRGGLFFQHIFKTMLQDKTAQLLAQNFRNNAALMEAPTIDNTSVL